MLTIESNSGHGVRITSVDIRSFTAPLLEPGDEILAVDGRSVHSAEGLERYLRSVSPGAMVVFTVLRNQSTIDYVMLQVPESSPKPPASESDHRQQPPESGS
jgi:S1-C subfamily serine protease